jgi:hypothetical protein
VRLFWSLLFVALFALVTWLTLTPNPSETPNDIGVVQWLAATLLGDPARADKIAHFLGYAALGGSLTLSAFRILGRRWTGIVALAFYGLFLEQMQGWGGVRQSDLLDALANMLGAAAAYPAAIIFDRLFVRLKSERPTDG